MTSTMQFANLETSPDRGRLVTRQRLQLLRAHGTCPREEPNLFVSLVLPVQRCSGSASRGYLDCASPREWEAAAGRFRALFAAFGIQSQAILLRLINRRLYIWPHVQEYLEGLDATREERLTRWTLGVQDALQGATLPHFPVEVAASPRRTEMMLESDQTMREQIEQAPGGTESNQNAGSKDTTPAKQPGTLRTRSESASATLGVVMHTPSNERRTGSLARGRQGRPRG